MSKVRRFASSPLTFALTSSVLCTGVLLGAAAAEGLTTKSGIFTAAQLERGKAVYEKSCVNCHQADFYRERLPKFQGKLVSELFESLSTTMPADNVGSLLTSEYLDVIAYIFSVTGSPPGKTELTSENMEAVKIAAID